MLIPPVNHALVVGEVYRSGYPIMLNYEYLDTLNLKTIVYIGDGGKGVIEEEYENYLKSRNLKFIKLPIKQVKEPFVETDEHAVCSAVELILDKRNHPILLHSDKGKHRVGVVVAVIRKCLQLWTLAPIYEEYLRFSKSKAEPDFLFIEQFNPSNFNVSEENYPRWVHGYRKAPVKPEENPWQV